MHFEQAIVIDAPHQRVWEVLSDIEAWPQREITVWDAPSYFEYHQKSGGVSTVAGHRVEALEEVRSRLTLTLDMRGLLVPVVGLFYKGLTNRYMSVEAQGIKSAAESG